MNKKNSLAIGIVFIIMGLSFILYNMNLIENDEMLIGLGVALVVGYIIANNIIYLVSGIVLSSIGLKLVIERYILEFDVTWFLIFTGLGLLFMVMYFKNRSKGHLFFGTILPAIGFFTLARAILSVDTGWILFLFLSISFFMMYMLHYSKEEKKWPLVFSSALSGVSIVFLLTSDFVGFGFYTILSIIWPTLLIFIGIKIVYNNIKNEG